MKFWIQVAAAIFVSIAVPASAGDVPGDPQVVFTTSVTGNVILGSWPDADEQTGLAAADRICQNRAAAGSLANAASYVAWISDSNDDAYCRLHGLTGKKADNCGQPSPPTSTGPWVRTDGYPFAPEIGPLLSPHNVVYTPPMFDEMGEPVSPNQFLLTATGYDGTLLGDSCGDWTDDSSGSLSLGAAGAVSGSWTSSAGASCSYPSAALLCMERSTGADFPPIESSGRIAFLSSASGNGNLGSWPEAGGATGLAAGDAICQTLAADAGLAHASSFKAWLSDDTTNAIDRIEHDGPWKRLDGVPLASGKSELTADAWFTGLAVDENGNYLVEAVHGSNVWTATQMDGTTTAAACQNWSSDSSADSGTRGLHYTAGVWRTHFTQVGCHVSARLYCLSDLGPVVFSDRFEN
ncbi:hypothetical protein G4Y73_12000 [Wenzhouxiangella sp. XN201]|uniref:hypothetical protein n=1 Tax=Wenzhouxiangella sp. XN201 TaxID=2710755 RepID=UPI0013C8602D|nr:hypothetical protein [Wenzhouxiangella sp. XN201]NEZ04875.1 hypothetical protein [Wenzhouxiangella sp. XN201]